MFILLNQFKNFLKSKLTSSKDDKKLLSSVGFFQFLKFKLFSLLRFRAIELVFFSKFKTFIRINQKSDLITCIDTFGSKFHYLYFPNTLEINQPIETILDLGSNIGTSLILYSQTFPNAKIIGVEMDASNYNICLRNSRHLKNIFIEHAAIWSSDDQILSFNSNIDPNAFSISKVNYCGAEVIKSISVDSIIQKYALKQIDILKVDVEGAEKELFFNGNISWLQIVKYLLLEFHDFDVVEYQKILEILSLNNFKVERQEDFWGNKHERGNLIAVNAGLN